MYCHFRNSTSARASALIIPRSATMHTDLIPNRLCNRSTIGTRLFTSAVLPGQSSLQTGLPLRPRIPSNAVPKSGHFSMVLSLIGYHSFDIPFGQVCALLAYTYICSQSFHFGGR
jgi:hypothetical protein